MARNKSADANAQHQVYVERLAATNANALDPELKALATYVRSRLAEEGPTIDSKAAMTRVVRDIRGRFNKTYDDWVNETGKFLNGLSDYETGFQTALLDAETTDDFTPKKPTNKSTRAKVRSIPMAIGANGGAVAVTSALDQFSPNETGKVVSLIQTGYYQGRTTAEIAASIAGTRKNRFSDGVLLGTKRNATNLSKTTAVHTSITAKDNVFQDNERAVRGYIITAVLDSRTSKTCRGLDDTRVGYKDDFQPRPPFHFNCRTTTRPWLRDDLDAIKQSERQTRGAGEPEFEPTAKDYYTWLKQQPAWFQDDVLGKTEGQVFRNAGLTPQEFKKATIERDGTPLNLEQMAVKDSRIADYLAE